MTMRSEYTACCPATDGSASFAVTDAVLGCAIDGAGQPIGTAIWSRVFPADGDPTVTLIAVLHDGTVVSPYTGEWGPCPTGGDCVCEWGSVEW